MSRFRVDAAEPYLDLNEVWLAQSNELRICLHLFHIPGFHQGQSVHCPLSLDGQKGLGIDGKSENVSA